MQSMSSSMDPSRQEPASIGGGEEARQAEGWTTYVCNVQGRAQQGGSRGDRVVAAAVEGSAAIRTGLAAGRNAARRCLVSGSVVWRCSGGGDALVVYFGIDFLCVQGNVIADRGPGYQLGKVRAQNPRRLRVFCTKQVPLDLCFLPMTWFFSQLSPPNKRATRQPGTIETRGLVEEPQPVPRVVTRARSEASIPYGSVPCSQLIVPTVEATLRPDLSSTDASSVSVLLLCPTGICTTGICPSVHSLLPASEGVSNAANATHCRDIFADAAAVQPTISD